MHYLSKISKRYLSRYIILGLLILLYTIILSYFSILRHNAFASGYDLSNMDQTVWNTLHGRLFSLTGDTGTISRFSIHGDIFLILLAPLYFLWDNVKILLIVQSLFLALGALPVFFLSKKLLHNTMFAFFFVCIYLLNPGMQWTNIYDFHSVAFAIPFLLFSFYFAYIKQWKWYFIFIVLSMMTKEEIPLTVAVLGIIVAFVFKHVRIGMITLVLTSIWLFFILRVISNFNPQHTYFYYSWYQLIETNITTTKFVNLPAVIYSNFFATPDAISYYSILLKEFAFLPLFGLPWIILSSPDLIINLFSDHAQMRSIFFQYDAGIIPGLIISSIFGVYYLHVFIQKFTHTTYYANIITSIIIICAVIIAIRVNYGYGPLPINSSCWCVMYQVTNEDKQFAKVLEQIPSKASVSASPEIRPHITHRENAYTIPVGTASADFVALIDQNRIVGNYQPKDLGLIASVQMNKKYVLVSHIDHFYLFKNKYTRY